MTLPFSILHPPSSILHPPSSIVDSVRCLSPFFNRLMGAEVDLNRNIHGVADVVELDGDELGHLLGKVAEIKGTP